ncbi:MAG: ABC transporter permease [Firmicutes bacterium]|nr:ABC transporter permease [Bacillota bacterium]
MKKYLQEMYRRKDLLVYLVFSGLKAEHRNSFLGYFWWVLDPLLRVAIYYFLVGILRGRAEGFDFVGFLVIGLMGWRWTASTMSRSAKAITGKAGIISKVYLPKLIFPIGTTFTQMVNFCFSLSIIALYLIISQTIPGMNLIWLPFIMLIQYVFLLAISMVLSYSAVFIRDIENLLRHITRLWFYSSPVIWEHGRLGPDYQWFVDLNPMASILNSYRNIFLYDAAPMFNKLLIIGGISLVVVVVMTYYYSRNEHKMIKLL